MPVPASSTTSTSKTTGQPSSKPDWLETETGNKVSRRARLHGTQHITLGGRCVISPGVCIRGDLVRSSPPLATTTSSAQPQPTDKQSSTKAKKPLPTTSVSLGRYVILSPHCTLTPPFRPSTTTTSSFSSDTSGTYLPLRIADHVLVHPYASISAASIGSHTVIGSHATLQSMCILKDSCTVLPGSVVPAGMVVPPNCIVGGKPARILGERGIGEGAGEGGGGDLREMWRGAGKEGGVGWAG
ncbi:MAG: hypothetical protein LQ351_006104 [Letrouitia transgressa]|nr:MAG: hypothetical protein LQ351_006104 [Letrouitia transgressa]